MIPHNENEVVKEFRAIKEEYAYNPDVMCLDDDRVRKIKYIIDNRLDAVDRTIILLYADCQSLRKVAKKVGVSHATIRTWVNKIRAKIVKEYEQLH